MNLFELTQVIDEGPRQDRVAALFTELKPVLDEKGPTEFRRAVMQALMNEFNCSVANASNIYTSFMKKSGVSGLSNNERRAAAGKEPVKARTKRDQVSAPSFADPAQLSPGNANEPAEDDDVVRQMITDTDRFDLNGEMDEDDIEWDRLVDGDNLVIEWVYKFYKMSSVEALQMSASEIQAANNELVQLGRKYRDRVVSYTPATMERSVKDDELFKGKPDTIRRLKGRIILKI